MPIYEYQCRKCKAHIEVFQKLNDKQPTKCRKCGGRLEKMLSAPAIQFKGSGWYVTDYADGGRKAAAKADTESSASDDKKPEKKSKETSPSKQTPDKASSTKPSKGD
ncbi:MAG: FmdB family zinc ribbon protein [Pyrinomonadaceae bacterium]